MRDRVTEAGPRGIWGRLGFTRADIVPSKFPGRARAGTRVATPAQARHGGRAGLARAYFAPCRAVPVTGQFRAVPRVARSARSGWTCILRVIKESDTTRSAERGHPLGIHCLPYSSAPPTATLCLVLMHFLSLYLLYLCLYSIQV